MNSQWKHVLLMAVLLWAAAAMIPPVGGNNTHNCHLLDRTGRRCSGGSGSTNKNGHSSGPSEASEDEADGKYGHIYGNHGHLRHSSTVDRSSSKKGGQATRNESWPGHSLGASHSWNALSHRNNPSNRNNEINELTTEVTTTEASNNIERFLVGRRRKRSALWMSPGLLINRAIGHSMSGHGHSNSHGHEEEEESESEDEEGDGGHSNENSRTSAVTRQIIHERSSNSGSHSSGGHGGGGHSGHGSSGHGGGGNHNTRTPLFLVPRTNTLKLKLM